MLRLSVPVGLLLVDLLLVLEAVCAVVEPDLNRNEVLVHALDHVLVLALGHHLVVVLLFDRVQVVPGVAKPVGFAHNFLLDRALLVLGLL